MTQLAQRLRLDLPNTLTRDVEFRTHLFERALPPILKTEAQSQHALFAGAERLKRCDDLLTQKLAVRRLIRLLRRLVLDEVAEMAIFFFSDRCLQ